MKVVFLWMVGKGSVILEPILKTIRKRVGSPHLLLCGRGEVKKDRSSKKRQVNGRCKVNVAKS